MKIEVPRDRSGSFEPLLIAKGQSASKGFEKVYRDVGAGDDGKGDSGFSA